MSQNDEKRTEHISKKLAEPNDPATDATKEFTVTRLTRRQFLTLSGGAAVALAASGAVLNTPEAAFAEQGALGVYKDEGYDQIERNKDIASGSSDSGGGTIGGETEYATGSYTPGTYIGEAQGMGGTVTATVTVDATTITDVKLEGPQETPTVGGEALGKLHERYLQAQSTLVDVVAGATVTSNAVKEAMVAALKQAAGIEDKEWTLDDINMVTGYFYAFVEGHSLTQKMPVLVRTHAKTFESIDISTENGETDPIRLTVERDMIPEMLANQSYEVDTVCGATVTSNALKAGVKDCLIQALEAGGTSGEAVSFFAKKIEKQPQEPQTIDVDVLVVGMGGTGTAALMAAAEAQADAGREVSVLAIEKQARYGGSSALTSSVLAVNPKKFQETHNDGKDYIDVDVLNKARDTSIYVKAARDMGYPYPLFCDDANLDPFWEIYVNESGDMLDWLIDHGFYFGNGPTGDFYSPDVVLNFEYAGTMGDQCKMEVASYWDHMIADYVELGGEYMLNTELTDLIYDGKAERVAGATARSMVDGTEYTINAKTVVLSTGGMGGNKALWAQHSVAKTGYKIYGTQTNDGKALMAAWNLGAGDYGYMTGSTVHTGAPTVILNKFPVNRIEGQLDPWIGLCATWSYDDIPLFLVTNRDTLFVNDNGERYANESPTWPMTYAWWVGGDHFYSITSHKRLQEIADNGFSHTNTNVFQHHGFQTFPLNTPIPEMFDIIEAGIEAGCIVKADTLEELAAQLGASDTSVLPQTVAKYNAACDAGVDEEFGKDPQYLVSIGNEGPFYAVFGRAEDYSSEGGLAIDSQFRVLKEDGSEIPGLYAAGTDCLGYMPCDFAGNAQGWAFLSGRKAGTNGATEALNMTGASRDTSSGGLFGCSTTGR
jgi:fumarate reductase flavoprotein subunit